MPDDPTARFYDELAEEYELILADWPAAVRSQGATLAALLGALGVAPPATVLDCTVGIGTQAIGLAAAGYRVRGTDLSPGAIRRAGREARRAGVDLPLQVADIRALRSVVHEAFDAVVTFDNSLAHLIEDSDLDRAATEMAALTRPGGVVAAGIRDYDALVVDRPSTTPLRTHDTSEERRASFQLWDWSEDGRTYRLEQVVLRGHGGAWTGTGRVSRLRALRRAELSRILVGVGLVDVRWHLPPDSGYYQPVVTARRPTVDTGEADTGPSR